MATEKKSRAEQDILWMADWLVVGEWVGGVDGNGRLGPDTLGS